MTTDQITVKSFKAMPPSSLYLYQSFLLPNLH